MARRRRTRILTRAVLIVWTAVVVLPLLWMFSTAFKTQGAIFPTPKYIPWLQFEPTLDAFRTVLTQYRSQLVNAFENSVISASASAASCGRASPATATSPPTAGHPGWRRWRARCWRASHWR